MNRPSALDHIIESVRTDPAGFAYIAAGIGLHALAERETTSRSTDTLSSIASVGLIAGGIIHLSNMFTYADAINTSLRDNGFEKTRFRIRAYCPRQVGHVVCKKAGYSELFETICEVDNKRFSFIPHI